MGTTITLSAENILLIGSILIFAAILITRVGYRYGVPTLLLFLVVGMTFGSDGVGLQYNSFRHTQFAGVVAMTVILFSGGLETDFKSIRPVLKQGVLLSTLGVLLTVAFTGAFLFGLAKAPFSKVQLPAVLCFLLAATMSSTDSASVFSILRGNRMKLKENLQPMLELESGSNDPMAYVLTIVLIEVAQGFFDPAVSVQGLDYNAMVWGAVQTLLQQLLMGTAIGFAIGYGTIRLLEHIKLGSTPLYAILLLTIAFFTFSITGMLGGNGLLAVYIAGIYIGNHPIVNKKEILKFMDGMTWIMQIGMFLLLGLLVNPHELWEVLPVALLTGVFQMFIGRPLSVFLTLSSDRKTSRRAKTMVSWVGLKGAAPIIFAIYPVVASIPGANQIFNVVFDVTMMSLLVQGMTLPRVATWLHLDDEAVVEPETFGVEIPEEAGILSEYTLKSADLAAGDTLKEIALPGDGRVVIIKRGETFIVPDGSAHLKAGDRLVLILTGEQGS